MKKIFRDELAAKLSSVNNPKLMKDVLENLFTPQELEELELRLQIFKLLLAGKNQREIAKQLNVSLATVSRGSRELKYGKKGISKLL